ncbi:hypothetical protein [Sorangium sp. So ce1389]
MFGDALNGRCRCWLPCIIAIARVTTARAEFGDGITFVLGQGNLMY